jgi:2,3-bisphosphoglycerate-independent phosphoglycerate mutase
MINCLLTAFGSGLRVPLQNCRLFLKSFTKRFCRFRGSSGLGNWSPVGLGQGDSPRGNRRDRYQLPGKSARVVDGFKKGYDFALLHIEAPDECTHVGDLKGKILAISRIDKFVVSDLIGRLEKSGSLTGFLYSATIKTLISTRGHDADPVPFLLYDSLIKERAAAFPSAKSVQERN